MELMGITGIAAITVICYLAAEIVKAVGLDAKFCPVVCGVLGAALGVAAMHVMPEFPGTDVITALAIGIVSGLAATGAHQIGKQLSE